ncbi:MAG: glycosyltransferase family 2 protein [Leptolyngbya sp. RL_3_1]|nr:glycosyltransferase family 2 protein [Leptolyngbya sp. RL_3_1]
MLDITVAIRTYNRASSLSQLLSHLSRQIQVEDIRWEVLVIDNNSSDNTAKVVQSHQLKWPFQQPLRYILEPVQGAAMARKRAFKEANSQWVGFIDDDNLPAQDWVYQAHRFALDHPEVGAYGGRIKLQSESNLPENFHQISVYLAIIDRGESEFCYNHRQNNVLPPGTNIVISKKAWIEAVPRNISLLGPSGKNLNSKGEDIEILSHIQKLGIEVWYAPNLQCLHNLPEWRLERAYLLSLAWGVGLGRHHIRMLRLKKTEKYFMPIVYFANDFRHFVHSLIKHVGLFKKDTVSAFHLILSVSILFSPIHSLITSKSKQKSALTTQA